MILVTLSDVVEINPRTTLKKGAFVKCAPMSSLEPCRRSITGFLIEEYKGGVKFRQGDTLMARITPSLENGKTALVDFLQSDEVGFGSTEFIVLRSIPGVTDSKYVYYLTVSPSLREVAIKSMTGTSGRQRVQTDVVKNYSFLLPTLLEQKAIAEVLSSLDDKIELLQKQNETLEALAQTLFRQWFIEEADDSWEEVSLTEIASFLNGLACQKYPPLNDEDKLPVLKIKDLKDGISDSSDMVSSQVDPKYLIKNGDVIFSWSASLVVKIWDGELCVLNQHLFKVTSEKYPKWFYYQWCKYHLSRFIAVANAHATTMGHIKRSDLNNAKVVVPQKKDLEAMSSRIEPLMDKIQLNHKQITTLVKTRDTLLPKLMSGQVRVKLD